MARQQQVELQERLQQQLRLAHPQHQQQQPPEQAQVQAPPPAAAQLLQPDVLNNTLHATASHYGNFRPTVG